MTTRHQVTAPWPYDAMIGGMPIMLALPERSGDPAGWHEEQARFFDQLVSLTDEDRSYAQWPPDVEFPYAQTSFVDGMGESDQTKLTRRRYHYGRYVDTSPGWAVKGPYMVDQAGISGTPVSARDFNGALYCAAGNKLYKRTSDSPGAAWSQVGSNLPGTVSGQMAVFQGTQSVPYLFIPLGQGQNYTIMSAAENFFQHASLKANHFEVRAHELWMATVSGNVQVIKKCEDGGTSPVWMAPTIVGDGGAEITGIVGLSDTLIVMKEDGPWSVSSENETIDAPISSDLAQTASATNGAHSCNWNGRLVFLHDGRLLAYDPESGALSPIGVEILEHNHSPIRGPMTAVAGHAGVCLFGVVQTDTTAYLMRYGAWEMVNAESGPARVFNPSWHGALYEWDKTVSLLHITSVYGTRPRLYVFFSDGSVAWSQLAQSANVTHDPAYLFDAAHQGEVYLSRYNALFPFEPKLLKGIGLYGRDLLGGSQSLGLAYRAAGEDSWVWVGSTGTEPGERLSIVGAAPAKAFDVKITLTTVSTSASPILIAAVVYSALRIEGLRVITATVKATEPMTDHVGRRLPYSWSEIKTALENAMTATGAISVVTPAGDQLTAIGLSYSHGYAGRDPKTKAPIWIEGIKMIQSSQQATRGTWDRCAAYTWADLSSLTWADLRQL